MRTAITRGGAVLLLTMGSAVMAGPPAELRLAAPSQVMDGDKPINASNGDAAPALMDFNRDGKKDLIVGQFDGGKARVYLNRGTNAQPRFKGFEYIAVGGKEITVPHG